MTTSAHPMTSHPSNLHVCRTSRASTEPPLPERVEQKVFVAPERVTQALALLRRACRPDPQFPLGQVNSLYFDTCDLEEHARSDAGDWAKDKIRIRWYGLRFDPHLPCGGRSAGDDQPVAVWVERKTRRGFASFKQRATVEVPASALSFSALGRGIVPPALLLETLAGFGFFPQGRLWPVIAISYWRYRFVEPHTSFRISIDSHIRSSMVMPGIGRGERGLELPGAVVEVKGPVFALPEALRPLGDIGASWTRYSKYSSSLDGHMTAPGSVSRLWPSGTLERLP